MGLWPIQTLVVNSKSNISFFASLYSASMRDWANLHKFARVCAKLHESVQFSRFYASLHESAIICAILRDSVRVCANLCKFARVGMKLCEFARNCVNLC